MMLRPEADNRPSVLGHADYLLRLRRHVSYCEGNGVHSDGHFPDFLLKKFNNQPRLGWRGFTR
ncbi:MAG TPA: hypothetical protein VH592_05900 [Gemmataceae bacterium]